MPKGKCERSTSLKLRLAMRFGSHSEERLTKKTARWNPNLCSATRTSRSVGRPRKRWEDDLNECVKCEETEESRGIDLKTWLQAAKKQKQWKETEK